MAKNISNIENASIDSTINVYAVRYSQREKNKNFSIALPAIADCDLGQLFCENVKSYLNSKEVRFNPTSNGIEDGTYEYVPLDDVKEKCNEILELVNNFDDYCGAENRKKVGSSNLFICEMTYDHNKYFLCARQGNSSDMLLKGRIAILGNQDKLTAAKFSNLFILKTYVGFIIDFAENKVLVFDKNAFQKVFKYDDYQKESVIRDLGIIDQWKFIVSTEIVKEKCLQKNVYRNLAIVFADKKYLEQISNTSPAQLKKNILRQGSKNFTEDDFKGNKLVITPQNLDNVMKMLAKGFKFNFFTNSAE